MGEERIRMERELVAVEDLMPKPFLHHTGFTECCGLRVLVKLSVNITHVEQMTILCSDPQT